MYFCRARRTDRRMRRERWEVEGDAMLCYVCARMFGSVPDEVVEEVKRTSRSQAM